MRTRRRGRRSGDEPAEIHHSRCDEAIDVAVVYGAEHMRAVVRHPGGRYGYWAKDAEWMTVLTF